MLNILNENRLVSETVAKYSCILNTVPMCGIVSEIMLRCCADKSKL